MKHRRGQSVGGHAQLGKDRRHGQGVGDVGIAALAQLALVGLLSNGVGPLDNRQVRFGVRGPNAAQ